MHATPDTSPRPFFKALPWLLFITSIFFFNFLARTILSPLMPAIEADLGISHAEAGRLFFDLSLGYSITLALSGFLSARFTHRQTITLSAIWLGCAFMGLAFVRSLPLIEILLFCSGMGCGVYLGSGIASMTSLVEPKDYGKSIATHEVAPNLSFIVAPIIAEALLAFMDWRGALAVVGTASVVLGFVFLRFGRGGDFSGRRPDVALVGSLMRRADFWILMLFFVLGLGASFGPYSVLPLFLTDERGMSPEQANHLLAISRLSGPVGVFVAGWLTDRLGPVRTLGWYLACVCVLTAGLGLAHGPLLWAVAILQPLVTVCFFPAGFALISRSYPESVRNVAVSWIVPFSIVAGNGMVPAWLGWMGDHLSFAQGFIWLGGLLFLGLAGVPLLAKKSREAAR